MLKLFIYRLTYLTLMFRRNLGKLFITFIRNSFLISHLIGINSKVVRGSFCILLFCDTALCQVFCLRHVDMVV